MKQAFKIDIEFLVSDPQSPRIILLSSLGAEQQGMLCGGEGKGGGRQLMRGAMYPANKITCLNRYIQDRCVSFQMPHSEQPC